MLNSKKKRLLPLKIVLLGMICFLLVFTLIPRVKTILELTRELDRLEQRKAKLEEKNKMLAQELENADSLATIEKIARERLGMVKDGEKSIIQVMSN